jgi:putative queuosine salvage protein
MSEMRGVSPKRLSEILDSRPDSLDVLSTTADVVTRAHRVTLNIQRIQTVAKVLALGEPPTPAWNYDYHFFDGTERTVTYLFLLDALNFCFWGEPRWTIQYRGATLDGYWALAAALKRGARAKPDLLTADYLATISPQDLAYILRGKNEIPLFIERWRNVQELGRALCDEVGGSAARLVERAQRNAPRLARLIADTFSSFDDKTIYNRQQVNFYKRAQILVADLWGAFGGKDWGEFTNLSELTAFADYKIPQILRAWGILEYDPSLGRRVNSRRELTKDSAEEIEIRASMLWGVELLREALARRGRTLTSVQMDWFLWESSQHDLRGMRPYHRVRTIYY